MENEGSHVTPGLTRYLGCERNICANREASFKRAAGETVSFGSSCILIGARSGESFDPSSYK